jgi:hypothetical protein
MVQVIKVLKKLLLSASIKEIFTLTSLSRKKLRQRCLAWPRSLYLGLHGVVKISRDSFFFLSIQELTVHKTHLRTMTKQPGNKNALKLAI